MKKILIGLMALVLCFTLASCGNKTDEKDAVDTGSANVENAENNADAETASTLENVNKDNYASILKERFGIDAKDIEEDGFGLNPESVFIDIFDCIILLCSLFCL